MIASRRSRRIIGYSTLFIFYLIIFLIILKWQSLYSINLFFPNEEKAVYKMSLLCPPASNGVARPIFLEANFNIEANKSIAEGVDIIMTNPLVILYPNNYENRLLCNEIDDVSIGFEGARISGLYAIVGFDNITRDTRLTIYNNPPGANFRVKKSDIDNCSYGNLSGVRLKPVYSSKFNFSVSGDYSPSIIVSFNNSSRVEYIFNEIKLHVIPTSELQTQGLNQINIIVAIALLAFSFFEGRRVIDEWAKEVFEQTKINDPEYEID
jgi:hypothetical protein